MTSAESVSPSLIFPPSSHPISPFVLDLFISAYNEEKENIDPLLGWNLNNKKVRKHSDKPVRNNNSKQQVRPFDLTE
jgi:hypothetical protein